MNWFAKKVFDKGGGKDLKNRCKTCDYFFKIFNFVKNRKILAEKTSKLSDRCIEKNTGSSVTLVNEKLTFAQYDKIGGLGHRAARACHELNPKQNPTSFFRKLRFCATESGSILIEFAICMPVLIILLFYIHDLVKIKRYYSQSEFVAQQFINIIQNISQNRPDKKIKKEDIAYAHVLAWQTVFPGTTMFYTNSRYPLGYVPCTHFYYVKGVENNKASCIYRVYISNVTVTKPADILSISRVEVFKNNHSGSSVRFLTDTAPANIYPTLKINKDDKKIVVETGLLRNTTWTSGASEKSVLGLHLVNPPMGIMDNWRYMFRSVVIFTPKPGLFDEDGPQ